MNALKALSSVTNLKDEYLKRHHKRVCLYACIIANKMDLSNEMCDIVRLAALYHDVGKIGIPNRILFKPGKLNETEWEIVKLHPLTGAELLSQEYKQNYNINWEIIKAVLHHHENYDGTGYPNGVIGATIPLASRIIAIADAFDAMTTDRPYKKAISEADAVLKIKNCSESQFDPILVNVFTQFITKKNEWRPT